VALAGHENSLRAQNEVEPLMNTTHKRTSAHAQTVETRIGKLDFELGVPTQATVKNLYDQMDFQRACQLYIWALPLVEFGNLQAILEGTTGAKPGDLTIYTGNEQSVFLTPNATTFTSLPI
jgi:hypothetical protein